MLIQRIHSSQVANEPPRHHQPRRESSLEGLEKDAVRRGLTFWLFLPALGVVVAAPVSHVLGAPPSLLHIGSLVPVYFFLAMCLHDAIHRAAHRNRYLNAAVGHVGAAAFGLTFPIIRRTHLRHHVSFGGEEDMESFVYRSRWLLVPRLLVLNWKCYAAAFKLGRLEMLRAAAMIAGIAFLLVFWPRETLWSWLLPMQAGIAAFALMTVYVPHAPQGEWVMKRFPAVTGFHHDHHEKPQYPWYQHFSRREGCDRRHSLIRALLVCCGGLLAAETTRAADPNRGLALLLTKPYAPSAFDQETFDAVWRTWPEPLRTQAEQASPEERRKMAFSRYGLTSRPGDNSGKPLQFVVDKKGKWSANCFTCHGGKVAGQVVPGLPNSRYAAQTMLEEISATAHLLRKPLPNPNYSGPPVPIQRSNGASNAVTLTFLLQSKRDADLNLLPNPPRPKLTHFDTDPPPWWRLKKRKRLYADGFAKKSHRALMVFLLDSQEGSERFHAAEQDFRDVLAWIETIEPPKYPFPI
ncbi:MAG: fatty acid desaturase, partial [Planctomycetales bacterium]